MAWREVTLFSYRVKMAYILVILLTASIYILHGLRTDSTQPYLSKIRQQVIRNNHTVHLKTTDLVFSMLNWVVYRTIWFQEGMSTKLLENNLIVIYVEGLSPNSTWLVSSPLDAFDVLSESSRVPTCRRRRSSSAFVYKFSFFVLFTYTGGKKTTCSVD